MYYFSNLINFVVTHFQLIRPIIGHDGSRLLIPPENVGSDPLTADPCLCHFCGPLAESHSKSAADPYLRTPSRSQIHLRTPICGPLEAQKSLADPYLRTPKSPKISRAFGAFPP